MTKATYTLIGTGMLSASAALAGDLITPVAPIPTEHAQGWCDAWKNIGTLYENKENPYIQKLKVFGRAQYQWGYTDGENDGSDFSGNGDELRRLRAGAELKFLNGFKFKGNANLEKGGFRQTQLGYHDMDEMYLSYSFGELGAFDDLTLTYGRVKYEFSGEAHESSKKIKTVERSNISNAFYGSARPTAFLASGAMNGVNLTTGIMSTDDDETLGQWDQGLAYYLSAEFEALNGNFILDYTYDGADSGDVDIFGHDWGVSAAYITKVGRWELLLNAIYGETHNSDALYGLVIMPSTFLIEDKLEAVFRYQYAGSDGDNIKINSRNVRNVASRDGVSVKTGDENHTFYGGLNYYICDHNAKIMTGVEYEILNGDKNNTDLNATTYWLAFRSFF